VAVEADVIMVSLSREAEGPTATLLAGFDPADGAHVWTSDLGAQGTPRLIGELDEGLALLAMHDELLEAVVVDRRDGEHRALHATSGQRASAAVLGDDVLIGVDRGVTRVAPEEDAEAVPLPGRVADVVAHEGRVALLLRSEDGGAVVWLELGDD
jgi:hypothetical protein